MVGLYIHLYNHNTWIGTFVTPVGIYAVSPDDVNGFQASVPADVKDKGDLNELTRNFGSWFLSLTAWKKSLPSCFVRYAVIDLDGLDEAEIMDALRDTRLGWGLDS